MRSLLRDFRGVEYEGLTPPPNPKHGDRWVLPADLANGIKWKLRFNAYATSFLAWEWDGGSHVYSEVAAQDAIGSGGVYVDAPTNPGPSIVVPRAGSYELQFDGIPTSLGTSGDSSMAPKLGAATALLADSVEFTAPNAGQFAAGHVCRVITRTLAAGDIVKMQYNTGGQTHVWQRRRLSIRPVRIS